MEQHRLLFVDDETPFLNSMTRALSREPYHLEVADCGAKALEIMREKQISIIVTDYMMPNMNGLELLLKVRAEYPHIMTIMLTAFTEIDIAMRSINEVGIYKFLTKPLELNTFKVTIRRTLETLNLLRENESLTAQIKTRDSIIATLESKNPGISQVNRDIDGYYIPDI